LLVLETGNSLRQSDDPADSGNRWVLEALNELGAHGVNTTLAELRRLEVLAKAGRIPSSLVSSYLAATVVSGEGKPFPVKPYSIVSVSSGDGKVQARIGILGISPADAAGGPETIGVDAALSQHLPVVAGQSDIVVLLARTNTADLESLARRFPALDVIVNGSPVGDGGELPKVGNTVIVQSSHAGIALGTLELEWNSAGHVTKTRNSMMPLAPFIPDSPKLAAIVEQAHREASALQEAEARRSPPVDAPSIFAGAGECKDCHEQAYNVWLKSAHARAFDTLKRERNEFNKQCLACHVTGFGVDRGFVNALRTPQLVNVQCEGCHGVAVEHSKSPQTTHPGLGLTSQYRKTVKKEFCSRCHTAENSPRFNFEQYWQKIAH
jgi:hypothetical protein